MNLCCAVNPLNQCLDCREYICASCWDASNHNHVRETVDEGWVMYCPNSCRPLVWVGSNMDFWKGHGEIMGVL